MFSTCPGIIPSLDVDIDEAVKLSSEISELEREISGLKIGSVLAWNHGLPKVVKELRKVNNCPIIFLSYLMNLFYSLHPLVSFYNLNRLDWN